MKEFVLSIPGILAFFTFAHTFRQLGKSLADHEEHCRKMADLHKTESEQSAESAAADRIVRASWQQAADRYSSQRRFVLWPDGESDNLQSASFGHST